MGIRCEVPRFVPITWDVDPNLSKFDAFVDGVGKSPYWSAIGAEYGVGPASSGALYHVHIMAPAPESLIETYDSNSQFAELLATYLGTTWPAPTQDTIYAFFSPPGTSVLLGPERQDACEHGIAGYHHVVTAPAGQVDVVYAVVPSCNFPDSVPGGGLAPAEQSIQSMARELIEAATDPYADADAPGWRGIDPQHLAWNLFDENAGSEVADLCTLYPEAFFVGDPTLPFPLQRVWSNTSAAAGHHPCVPAPKGAYFNVTPLGLADVTGTSAALDGGAPAPVTLRGVRIPEGQTGRFAVGFYSDGPTASPWTIAASIGNPLLAARGDDPLVEVDPSRVTVTIDKTTGENGEIAQVTVAVAKSGRALGGELLTITSTLGGVSHYMPVWIAAQ